MRRELLQRCTMLPVFPDVVARILALIEDPTTEPPELEKHLGTDPVLATRLLSLVNSPFFAMNREIKTISEAVVVIGFFGVRSLVLATTVARHFEHGGACSGYGPDGLWRHSVAVASGARAIARATRRSPRECEELFVVGLVHDIGKMLLAPYLQDALEEPLQPREDAAATERRLLGIDHGEVGAWITERWGLPDSISEVVLGHAAADARAPGPAVAAVRLADDVAHGLAIGFEPGRAPEPGYRPEDLTAIGLDEERWEQIQPEVHESIEAAVQSLDELKA